MDCLDFFIQDIIKGILMIKKGIPLYNGDVYFKIKYNIEKTVTTNSKSFSFLLNVLVYAIYNKYTIKGNVVKTISKIIVSNIFIFITDNILQNYCVEVCRKMKTLYFSLKKALLSFNYTLHWYHRFRYMYIYTDCWHFHKLF